MGTAKKTNIHKTSSKRKVKYAKASEFTPEEWKLLTQKETLFPKKLAKANEMHAKTKFMDE